MACLGRVWVFERAGGQLSRNTRAGRPPLACFPRTDSNAPRVRAGYKTQDEYSRSDCPTLPLSQSPVDESPSLSSFWTLCWTSLRASSSLSGDDDAGRDDTASASSREARCDDDGDVDGEDEDGSDMGERRRS